MLVLFSNKGGVSVIVTVPHGLSPSKLLAPSGTVSSISLIGASGKALLRGAAGAAGAPSAAIAALNDFVAVLLMSEWLGFYSPTPILVSQTSSRESRPNSDESDTTLFQIKLLQFFFLFNFL